MPRRFITVALLFALGTPWVAHAEAPPSVEELQVEFRDAEIVLSWNKISQDDIAYYRIYYSTKSILGNNGEYDDFDQTDGPRGQYTFKELPPGDKFYAAVMAVNDNSEESAYFAEEVAIDLPKAPSSPPPTLPDFSMFGDIVSSQDVPVLPPAALAQPTEAPAGGFNDGTDDRFQGKLHLLAAQSLSPTSVSLTFSHSINIDPNAVPQAFIITTAKDDKLLVHKVVGDSEEITIETDVQEKGAVYEISVSDPLRGIGGQSLDSENRQSFFIGHEEGRPPLPDTPLPEPEPEPVVQEPVPEPTNPPPPPPAPQSTEVKTLQIRAIPSPDGLYNIDARWEADNIAGGLSHFIAQQSIDGGKTFGDPQTITVDVRRITVDGVYPGNFGLSLQVANLAGEVSPGTFRTIPLAGTLQHPLPSEADTSAVEANVIDEQEPPIEEEPPREEPEETPEEVLARPPAEEDIVHSDADDLPGSGNGFLLFTLVISGVLVGWKESTKFHFNLPMC